MKSLVLCVVIFTFSLTKGSADHAHHHHDSYSGYDSYGSPLLPVPIPLYDSPQDPTPIVTQDTYGALLAPVAAPSENGYGAPLAPVVSPSVDDYGAPQAPVLTTVAPTTVAPTLPPSATIFRDGFTNMGISIISLLVIFLWPVYTSQNVIDARSRKRRDTSEYIEYYDFYPEYNGYDQPNVKREYTTPKAELAEPDYPTGTGTGEPEIPPPIFEINEGTLIVVALATAVLVFCDSDICRMDELAGFPMFKRSIQPKPISSNGKVSRGGSRPAAFPRSNGQHAPDGPARVLDVKVVKAVQLGGQAGNCLEPYVVVEVDDPSQRQQTRPGSGPQTQWNETFSMDITSCSSEVLFEVWDQGQKIGKSDTFLGLGIVSVSELMCTVSQRHVIPLQGRPYEEDQVTGMLTIEFLFKDGGISFSDTDTMHGVHKTLEMRQSKGVGGGVQYNTKTTYFLYEPPDGGLDSVDWAKQAAIQEKSAPVDGISLIPDLKENITILRRESYIRANKQDLLNGADVADLAIQELAARSRNTSLDDQPTKSTLLIHAVQKPPRTQSSSVQSPTLDSTENVCSDSLGDVSLTSKESGGPLRRGREKKRNLISTIKKRFSGTRSLSTSMKFEDNSRTSSSSRVPSLDRIRSASEHRSENFSNTSEESGLDSDSGCSLSLASWRGNISMSWESGSYLTIPGLHSEDASSMSDVSGISAASNKTYVTEDSSLVLETLEDGRHHHYLIPAQVAKRGRFKKRGIKLHIYLDHIFVARHIKLGTVCSACDVHIPIMFYLR
ncbi:uncharacterized protein LOC111706659 [Eurytemora carolleeae]|uniref:uncharacterized protein LOC111706659 n=1 Tax=Eurytemora carolleeae TaxID=1294199 RepID=UPI000C779655|nr:uncharacterized protein LOC111706659 [Eurytemora carolleeae]|eukprot:XP_023335337.1 uncharacterized protein LOC111706659 [Eurytemora affinis]